MRTRFIVWLPALAWAGFILYSGGSTFSAAETQSWLGRLFELDPDDLAYLNIILRKLTHLLAYALLAALLLRAIGDRASGLRRAAIVLAACFVVALADEFRQSFEAARSAAPGDLVLDMLGTVVTLRIASRLRKPGVPQPGDNQQKKKVLGIEPD